MCVWVCVNLNAHGRPHSLHHVEEVHSLALVTLGHNQYPVVERNLAGEGRGREVEGKEGGRVEGGREVERKEVEGKELEEGGREVEEGREGGRGRRRED